MRVNDSSTVPSFYLDSVAIVNDKSVIQVWFNQEKKVADLGTFGGFVLDFTMFIY